MQAKQTKKEQLEEILNELKNTGGIIGSAVVSVDGLVIASDLKEKDVETFAAMSAAMQGAAETAVGELGQGNLNQIVAEAEKGKLIAISSGEKAILVVMTNSDINLGLILLEMRKASGMIMDVLK